LKQIEIKIETHGFRSVRVYQENAYSVKRKQKVFVQVNTTTFRLFDENASDDLEKNLRFETDLTISTIRLKRNWQDFVIQ
jgi:hypothetical protein